MKTASAGRYDSGDDAFRKLPRIAALGLAAWASTQR
jgi:hypothetical protein